MGNTTFKKWLTGIALFWGAVIVLGMLAPHNATTAAVTETVSEPPKADHHRQGQQLAMRLTAINDRLMVLCHQLASQPAIDKCETSFRNSYLTMLGQIAEAEASSYMLLVLSLRVDEYEVKINHILQDSEPLVTRPPSAVTIRDR